MGCQEIQLSILMYAMHRKLLCVQRVYQDTSLYKIWDYYVNRNNNFRNK